MYLKKVIMKSPDGCMAVWGFFMEVGACEKKFAMRP